MILQRINAIVITLIQQFKYQLFCNKLNNISYFWIHLFIEQRKLIQKMIWQFKQDNSMENE